MRFARRTSLPLLAALALITACASERPTQPALPDPPRTIATPTATPRDESGNIKGAPYRIVVPPAWNGALLVYAHGYRDKADHPGEVDNRNADIAPNDALANALLAQGYALAGSAWKDNGWAIEDAVDDLRKVVTHFRSSVTVPARTILWGVSAGALAGAQSMERFGGLYDGALLGCAPLAGATRSWDASADLLLAYDVVFSIPASWGTVGDLRDDIDFETEVQPKLIAEVSNPVNFPRFEFLRLVSGIPGRGITPPPPPAFFPGWAFTSLFYGTEVRAELERRAGGAFVQNADRNYTLSGAERSYLDALGVPATLIDGWLAAMNARRTIKGRPSARNFVDRTITPSGRLLNPVMTVHTIFDPLVSVSQSQAYGATVTEAGREARLLQLYTAGNGHCNFTGPQVLTALAQMDSWVQTGVRPELDAFPALLGFVTNFVPPAPLQP